MTNSKPFYFITDWEIHFECSQSRKIKSELEWIPVKTKHDGLTFRKIMSQGKRGLEIYAVWHLVLQVAGRCPKRGVLIRNNNPLTAEDISLITGAPAKQIQDGLDFLSDQSIGWVGIGYQRSGSAVGAQWEATTSAIDLHGPTEQNRTEQNRTLQNRTATEQGSHHYPSGVGAETNSAAAAENEISNLLSEAGFDRQAVESLKGHSLETIKSQIAWIDKRNPGKNKLGMLRMAIEGNWPEPAGNGRDSPKREHKKRTAQWPPKDGTLKAELYREFKSEGCPGGDTKEAFEKWNRKAESVQCP